ncbi:MAG: GCN5-related N-acetyltransferase [Verrucomicrobiales bacterium]|nr:GCN5-related N-acetyltransferase [Verrucomicrobiales bacterium]
MSVHSKTAENNPALSQPQRIRRVHHVFSAFQKHPLEPMFAPRSIALIGATEKEGSVGRTILSNLISGGFEGSIYPINPKRQTVLGLKASPDVASLPEIADLAVIVTPAPTVPQIIGECVRAGFGSAIIISAGFKETGPEGVRIEEQIRSEAKKGRMRIIGPNCLGVMTPHHRMNATFGSRMARPGSVAFISQSGALCTAILDWSFKENVGFSAFVSLGSMLDVNWGDLIYYLGNDPLTKSIVMYMESIGDARSFLSAAREVALTKPIIVIKVGRTEAAAKAAASHTGSLTGSDDVLEAAFRRVGVLRVDSIAELFDMAEVLGKQPRPQGPRLAIVTNAGGPGVLATDALIGSGSQLAALSPESLCALNEFLPPHWSHANPVDILGDAGPAQYGKAVQIVADDPNNDGVLVILTPQAMTNPTGTAGELKRFSHLARKPILASWMGGVDVEPGVCILNGADIPTFAYPDRAARAFHHMWSYSYNLRALYETPALRGSDKRDVEAVRRLIATIQQTGRTLLTEAKSKRILSAYGIPVAETRIAKTEDEAADSAGSIGFPVVLKLYSETLTHKTDVGGVRLNLADEAAVRQAWRTIRDSVTTKAGVEHFLGVTVQPMIRMEGYELILGSSIDPQFGPVLLFGLGGQLVEVFKDRALGLPPLNGTLARRMMERTRVFEALQGVRGRESADLAELEKILVRFSELVVEQPWIKEIDINPLLVSPERIIALDARIVLHDSKTTEDRLPRPSIRPYPDQYVRSGQMKRGTPVLFRPIRPEDEEAMVKFHHTLSEQSVYYRYFSHLKIGERIAHERLTRICFTDYDREIPLVAEMKPDAPGRPEILGVGRLSKLPGLDEAEFALLVSDAFQGQGLGRQLLTLLVEVARSENLKRILGCILPENRAMLDLCTRLGFELSSVTGAAEIQAVLDLPKSGPFSPPGGRNNPDIVYTEQT